MYSFPQAQTKEMFELVLFVLENRMTCYSIGDSLFNRPRQWRHPLSSGVSAAPSIAVTTARTQSTLYLV
jgi:hypothetical protein